MITFRFRKVHRSCVLLFPVLLSLAGYGQVKNYSLPALTDSARHYLPLLAEKQALVEAARASITDTRHSFLPKLRLSEQVNIASDNSLAGTYFTYGITPSTSSGVRGANTLDPATANIGVVSGEYELYNFGLNNARVKNAEAYADLQMADLHEQEYLLDAEIATLYFDLLKSEYLLAADQQNVERYRQIFSVIKALTQSGINAGVDSSQAKAELSRTIVAYQQTLGTISQVKEQLSSITGIPALQINIDTSNHHYDHDDLPKLDFQTDTLYHPLIDYFKKYRSIFQTNEQVIRKTYQPKILLNSAIWARGSSIQYSDQYKSLGTGFGYQRFNYAFAVSLSYDLLSGIYKKDKLAVNRLRYEASDAALQQQELNLASANRQADQSLATIKSNLDELPVQLEAARATYEQKLAQYKAGLISLIDLTNASFVLYRSQTDYIELVNDWYLAGLAKAKATGHLAEFIQSIN